ncbi:MAG: hypothetical protein ACRD3W_14575 [Terriglobales bacterium]
MFAWKEKKNVRSQINKVTAGTDRVNVNRRAVGLVPSPIEGHGREVFQCRELKYQHLLLTIEGKQGTCCVRVTSPTNKSRAAILILRGRVLGCLYGSKNMTQQAFGQDALRYTLADMASPDTLAEVYILTEEIALAAASLFHSKVMPVGKTDEPMDLLERAINGLLRTRAPGCVVISDSNRHALCMIYVCGGSIAGIYSFCEGWLDPSFEMAELCLASTPDPKVSACALTATNMHDVYQLTFSLTGLVGERHAKPISRYEYDFDPQESCEPLGTLSSAILQTVAG